MFRLAGHLKMTVRELSERMDSREFAEWKAFCRYFEPFGDEWRQAALMVCAALAPYCRRDKIPKPDDFMPSVKPPQSPNEMRQEMLKLQAFTGISEIWQARVDDQETPST